MNVAVIVAHPDDEVIWSGGLILEHPDWNWTVLSLSRRDDPDRCPKFKSVCELLGVRGFITDLDDSSPPRPIDSYREIGDRVKKYLTPASWDICITHGGNGEYGHQRHKQVHAAVLKLADDNILKCRELWTFAYDCGAGALTCCPDPQADIIVELSEAHLCEKRRIVRQVYGYNEESFEVRACISPESFRKWENLG
ncbi:MAG: PIG-L family deacetylase [Planctomycetota bacterium]|nr:PIG-L family deacetylase [Planctomycetota bacterium]